ncbi:MAG: pentapeptide repeat-containing protein, partial [Planctomycetaceae bacterium]|nr:pentapeptide repeat-containing protein [Planctomycetaceae bacterium]
MVSANLSKIILWDSILDNISASGATFAHATLSHVSIADSTLDNACFSNARITECVCNNSRFVNTNCHDARFMCCHLVACVFTDSLLTAAHFYGADISSAQFDRVIVDGATLFANANVADPNDSRHLQYDKDTDFTATPVSSMRVHPAVQADLEYNVRRLYWRAALKTRGWLSRTVWTWFWESTDYGHSTGRIAQSFAVMTVFYSLIYLWGAVPAPHWWPEWATSAPLIQNLSSLNGDGSSSSNLALPQWGPAIWWRSLYFSVVTTTTLGFGDISANPRNPFSYPVVCSQVVIGYLFLAMLITRLSVLMQRVR